jgi:hypothetical protein
VNVGLDTGRIGWATPEGSVQGARAAGTAWEEMQLSGMAALRKAVAMLPSSRAEVVDRAKEVLCSVRYPPEATVDRIAALLGLKLGRPEVL